MTTGKAQVSHESAERAFLVGLSRAFGGAIVFALPMLMTMEMWWLGFAMHPLRLALLILLVLPLLVGLSHFVGFEETFDWRDDVVDAFAALGVGFVSAIPILLMFGVVKSGMAPSEIAGKIAVQAVPGSFGALLAQSQFGSGGEKGKRKERRGDTYRGETFFMTVGALFLSLNVAPTEEVVLISYQMTPFHAFALASTSILLMHAFVYSVGFSGESSVPEAVAEWSVFFRYTIVGYAICLVISAYILWTFGRVDGLGLEELVTATVVLAFPASIGASAARLIL